MAALHFAKCNQIGCGFEAAGEDKGFVEKAFDSHLATRHGIGAVRKVELLGCPALFCYFQVEGSREYVRTVLADHLRVEHGVDPDRRNTLPSRMGR